MAVNLISGINSISSSLGQINKTQGMEESPQSFGEYLKTYLDNVNDLQMQSDAVTNDFVIGKTDNIHEVMIAAEKANISLQLTMQIRNKVLDAYNEIMRMQI